MRYISSIVLVWFFFTTAGFADAAIIRNLSLGARGSDVIELQTFLIGQGLLSSDSATGYFGTMTQAAVQSLQRTHGIVASGDAQSTGYGAVGPRTRSILTGTTAAAVANPHSSLGGNASLISDLQTQIQQLRARIAGLQQPQSTPLPATITYSWETSVWGTCSSGTQTRTVVCRGTDQNTYDDSRCSGTKPVLRQSCTITTAQRSCTLDGISVADGASRMFYRKTSIPASYNQSCSEYGRTRTCTNGTLSGGEAYGPTGEYFNKANCSVSAPTQTSAGSCTLDGVTIAHGASRMYYRLTSVPASWEQTCAEYGRNRTCANGVLSGGEVYQTSNGNFYFNKATCQIKASEPTLNDTAARAGWTITFSDEFSEKKDVWSYQNSAAPWIGGYLLPEHSVVSGGLLRIMVKKGTRAPVPAEPTLRANSSTLVQPSTWESASMWTKEDFGPKTFFEARIKLTAAQNIDNAFWLMFHPIGPEIDIVEAFWGDQSSRITHSLHPRLPNSGVNEIAKVSDEETIDKASASQFHTYGLLWDIDKIIWYFDGAEVFRETRPNVLAYFKNTTMRIRLSTAPSSIFGVVPASADGSSMQVDYVRVWKRQ